ncbi:hypothetical protein AVEN_203460-1 [Araneus ventricosus]|uniref:Uncharacterized protein n=1 Tax=Araneus ventricosus TaxID=182803 RepID=A0A4Y2BIT6_ARAVE|nr:hypothetical protein AVEN_203460-1 [Araneus ventricosus]
MALYHRQKVLSSDEEWDSALDERASCAHLSGVNLYCGNGSTGSDDCGKRPEAKKISLHHAPVSHFESRGESPSSRQTAKNLKRAKARLELKLFLPRKPTSKVEPEWVERAVDCPHITQSERGSLFADQRASFNFNWEEGGF